MDELLMARVNQLKAIEERLERIGEKAILYSVTTDLRDLRRDVLDMIRAAEKEHADF